jgi:hypothetical protein
MNLPIGNEQRDAVSASAVRPKPVAGSLAAALVASLCCGGSLLFASIGLGGLYATLGLFRYVPQFLAGGTLTIVAINWLYYRHLAAQPGLGCDCAELHRAMYLSTFLGLVAMAGSFLVLEWLNHALVNAARFMSRPEYAYALIPGVPNQNLAYAALSLVGVGLVGVLPVPARLAQDARVACAETVPTVEG